MTPRRFILYAVLAWLCWLPKTELNWMITHAGYFACGVLIAILFQSRICSNASRKVFSGLVAAWGAAGIFITTRSELMMMGGTNISQFVLPLLPPAIIVVMLTSKKTSPYQIVMRCFLFIVTTSLLLLMLGAGTERSLLTNSWLLLMSAIASFLLLSIKVVAKGIEPQTDHVFISYTLRDPRGAFVAQALKSTFDKIGLPYYDYVPSQEAPSARDDDQSQEIESALLHSVTSSCCTCEIISNVTICREWIQYERSLIRQKGLHRFFLILDSEFLDRHSIEASGPITRMDCTWMLLQTGDHGANSWDGLTESILTNTQIKPLDQTRSEMIHELVSGVADNVRSPRAFRAFCRDFACRINLARCSRNRGDAFMKVHQYFQGKGLAKPSLR